VRSGKKVVTRSEYEPEATLVQVFDACHPAQVLWQTKAGRSRPVEHRSKASADAAVADARCRYLRGATAFRLVRVTDPAGNLRIIDFEHDRAREDPRAAALAAATDARKRAHESAARADEEWKEEIRKAREVGVAFADIARVAGTTLAHVRMVLSKR
jgi:hypothetical protein